MIILFSNYDELSWDLLNPFHLGPKQQTVNEDVALEKLLLQPHLNTALRAEILYFTTQGIIHAAKDYHKSAAAAALTRQMSKDGAAAADANAGVRSNRTRFDEDSAHSEFSLNESSGANIRFVDFVAFCCWQT